jgi:hypothetical protein
LSQESLKRRLQKLQVTNAKDKRAIDDNSASLAGNHLFSLLSIGCLIFVCSFSPLNITALEESFEKIFRATGNVEMDVDLLVKVSFYYLFFG